MYNPSYVCVSAVDSTGAEPDYFDDRPRKSDSISVEVMTCHIFKPEPHSVHCGDHRMRSPRISRFDVPTKCFTARDPSFLAILTLPPINSTDIASWYRDLSFKSFPEPLGDMADRLLDVGNRIIRSQPRQPLRIAVAVTKLSILPSNVFGKHITIPLQHTTREELNFVYAKYAAKKAAAINNARPLEMVRYQGSKSEDDSKLTCAICLDDVHIGSIIALIPCFHKFHGDCLTNWKKDTCPICRSPLT